MPRPNALVATITRARAVHERVLLLAALAGAEPAVVQRRVDAGLGERGVDRLGAP